MTTTSNTASLNTQKYEDWMTNELMKWVWDNDEQSAAWNIPRILAEYERRKTFGQRLRSLFLR